MRRNLRSIIQVFPKWHNGQLAKGDTRTIHPRNTHAFFCKQNFYKKNQKN